ncbi:unnamed protein product [Brassica oleracea var. botrytis]|uniref:Agenet-like domain-containing protein n=2 Tax=Brassica TaxID=3705 RepID=A0A3P6GIN9_BRAOL|nr:unnamed protein product [Brassica napus]VDD53819.1 unnamed protein product [Brassica oleracea]
MDEFVKGNLVEVCSKEDGFFGSLYKVKYKNLVTEQPLIETISADEIRPMPPKLSQPSMFSRHDKVDAFDLDAW